MELLSAILPFFGAGLLGAVFSRFTGMNMSMCLLMIFLYMGAKPGELIVAMLLFNVFTYFTVYSQEHRMNMKTFVIFPGVKFLLPVFITVILAAVSPFFSIVFFVIVFLLEIFAKIYQGIPQKVRPTKGQLVQMCVIASVLVVIGAVIVEFIPTAYYYILAGIVILAFAALMWFAGDRKKWNRSWDTILYGTTFLAGLTGIDATDWLTAMRRNEQSVLSRCYPIVINSAMVVGLIAAYLIFRYFSLGALFSTIGAAVGVRFFGVETHSTKGKFSYLTLGIAVLAALVFMIIQPQPVGFPELPMSDEQPHFQFFNF